MSPALSRPALSFKEKGLQRKLEAKHQQSQLLKREISAKKIPLKHFLIPSARLSCPWRLLG